MLTIDRVSKRYGVLPSHALRTASTFDLKVANTAMAYEIYCQQEANKTTNAARGYKPMPQMSMDQMKAAMAKVRNKK
jgi:hypothetical protein